MAIMDKIIDKLDTHVLSHYSNSELLHINTHVYSISVLVKSIDNLYVLYRTVRMHPELTEDILVSIIKRCKRSALCLERCWLITQEFCEKYKSEFTLTVFEMICNHLPLKYIIDTHGITLNNEDRYSIARRCIESEYNEYCKPFGISPHLDNPNMTLDWYMSCYALNGIDSSVQSNSTGVTHPISVSDINWLECVSIRPDLFTPDVIMTYKDSIPTNCKVWNSYFNKFPVAFIEKNLALNYTGLYNCIETFKNHPGGISWYTIDKYITYRIIELESSIYRIDIPDNISDLPCWFVKKYSDAIVLNHHHMNTQLTYKFIAKNINLIDSKLEINKIRAQYISMLNDIVDVFDKLDVNPDLYDTILEYC
jgi:hypothetical protein